MFLRQLTKSRLPISRLPRHINIIQQSMKPSFFSTHAIDIKDQRIDSALDRKLQEQPRKTNLKRTVTHHSTIHETIFFLHTCHRHQRSTY